MCKSSIHSLLAKLPKCEQHMHVEGALTPELLFTLAKKKSIEFPKDDPAYASPEALAARYKQFSCLQDFLDYYIRGMNVLTEKSDFEQLAWSYYQHAARDGVVHSEMFFDPQAHTQRNISLTEVVEGLKAAGQRAEKELGITNLLIPCFMRHLPVSSAHDLFDSKAYQAFVADHTFPGVGLASSENGFPPELFVDVYKKAEKAGLRLTSHAGEEGPASNIDQALTLLKCTRIDHGIRLAENPALMQRVAQEGILLTVCPLSNVYLKCASKIEDVPIRKFLDAGVKFSINSDDPTYLGGFILDNYCAVQDAFQLSVAEWETICTSAINGSWCTESRKQEIRQRLEEAISSFENSS